MPQPGRCQGFGETTTQIVIFRAIELKPLSPIQLACNREAFSISIQLAFPSLFVSSLMVLLIPLFVVAMSKPAKTKKLFKKIVVVVFNNLSSFVKSKVTKLKLKVKRQSITSFFVFAKKFANKISFLNVDIYQIFFDFDANLDVRSNNKFNSNKDVNDKTFINATIVTKISLNKKNRIIASEIVNCCERRFSNKRFKTI